MNGKVKIHVQDKRLHYLMLLDVAVLGRVQSNFLISHTVHTTIILYFTEKKLKLSKIRNASGCFLTQLHSTNLANAIFYLVSWLCHSWQRNTEEVKKLFIRIRFSYSFQNCDNVYIFLKTVNMLSLSKG